MFLREFDSPDVTLVAWDAIFAGAAMMARGASRPAGVDVAEMVELFAVAMIVAVSELPVALCTAPNDERRTTIDERRCAPRPRFLKYPGFQISLLLLLFRCSDLAVVARRGAARGGKFTVVVATRRCRKRTAPLSAIHAFCFVRNDDIVIARGYDSAATSCSPRMRWACS